MTKIQTFILNTIAQTDGHMTAEQVLAIVKKEHPTASLSTVYRNLNLFSISGKIRRIQRASGADYYDRNLDPHDHACCTKCGKIVDIKLPGLKGFLERSFVYPVLAFDLLISYLCPECAVKQAVTHQQKSEERSVL